VQRVGWRDHDLAWFGDHVRIVHVNRGLTVLDHEDLGVRMPVQRGPAARRRMYKDQRHRQAVVRADELVRIGRARQVLDLDDWIHVTNPPPAPILAGPSRPALVLRPSPSRWSAIGVQLDRLRPGAQPAADGGPALAVWFSYIVTPGVRPQRGRWAPTTGRLNRSPRGGVTMKVNRGR
jgi:hypothetical protein